MAKDTLLLHGNEREVELPMDRAAAAGLRELTIAGFRLERLPEPLFGLEQLTHLSLSGLPRLESLAGVERMEGLETLRVTELPRVSVAEVFAVAARLPQLSHLVVGPSRDVALPPELDGLGQVLHLNLFHFERLDLAAALPRVARLGGLRRFSLYAPPGDLPDILDRFGHLDALVVQRGTFRRLPPSVGALSKLVRLDVSHNRLGRLPPELGRLAALQELDLSYNLLRTLPDELRELGALRTLNLTGNRSLKKIPDGVCRRGMKVTRSR